MVIVSLVEAFSRIPRLHKLHLCLQGFSTGFSRVSDTCSKKHQFQHLASWTKERLSEALNFIEEAHPQDAGALIEIAKGYDAEMFKELYVAIPPSFLAMRYHSL